MAERKHFRCAIYTRKSSEEGLEQDFNSAHQDGAHDFRREMETDEDCQIVASHSQPRRHGLDAVIGAMT